MRRVLLAIAALAVTLGPMGARAETEDCGLLPDSCVAAETSAEIGCDVDGRGTGDCAGTLIYEVSFDSVLPIESMDYEIAVTCSAPGCVGGVSFAGTCGWAPPEVRPIGETGCALGDVLQVSFTPDVAAGSCATYQVGIEATVRTVLDPEAETSDASSAEIDVCA